MNYFDKIMQHLKAETENGSLLIDLTPLFVESGLSCNDFNEILKNLEDEKLLNFNFEITTSDLVPTRVFLGRFGDITGVDLGGSYVYKFEAKLTFKGSKYSI
jgi:hypothetical protein